MALCEISDNSNCSRHSDASVKTTEGRALAVKYLFVEVLEVDQARLHGFAKGNVQ